MSNVRVVCKQVKTVPFRKCHEFFMEIIVNFSIWTGAVLFSLFSVYTFGRDLNKELLYDDDFDTGWGLIGRDRDVSDFEWTSWKTLACHLLPWIVAHIFISNIFLLKSFYKKLWYFLLPLAFIMFHFGFTSLLIMLIQPFMYWIVLRLYKKLSLIWGLTVIFLAIMNAVKYFHELNVDILLSFLNLNNDNFYLMLICTSWIQLRCISYCFDSMKLNSFQCDWKTSILDLLSYCFYLPLLIFGPMILFDDFNASFLQKRRLTFGKRLYNLCINLTRFLGWFLVLETSLHFIYFNAMQYHEEILEMMPDWCLYGGGFWMGLYFYMKYLITYGIASSLAAVDNIVPETPPLCIARVHLYSQMWRYFDVGLYKFLIKYLYRPVLEIFQNTKNPTLLIRSSGSLTCFTFVLFWHGTHSFILIWTMLNFIGIIIENIGMMINRSSIYNKLTANLMRDVTKERFHAFLSVPMMILSALSNFYFFAGSEIGRVFVNRVLTQSLRNYVGMFVCIYSCCRTSQYFMNVRVRKIKT